VTTTVGLFERWAQIQINKFVANIRQYSVAEYSYCDNGWNDTHIMTSTGGL